MVFVNNYHRAFIGTPAIEVILDAH